MIIACKAKVWAKAPTPVACLACLWKTHRSERQVPAIGIVARRRCGNRRGAEGESRSESESIHGIIAIPNCNVCNNLQQLAAITPLSCCMQTMHEKCRVTFTSRLFSALYTIGTSPALPLLPGTLSHNGTC
jgi:hypothetical protein